MSGETTTGSLADSLPTVVADARIVREYEGVWRKTTEVRNLDDNSGLNWNEISLAPLQAMDITETTNNENAQSIADTLFAITPLMSQILIKITDRTYRRIASVVKSKVGTLAGNAMARKKDEDYLSLFSTFSAAVDPGASSALANGHISAAVTRILSNGTEGASGAISAVLHGYQVYDLKVQVVPGSSTLVLPDGVAPDVWRKGIKGLRGECEGAMIYVDGNIPLVGTEASDADATGAVHAKEGVVSILGMSLKKETRRDPAFGGGADEVFLTDEYGFGERSAGNWCYQMTSDATAPTS